MNHGLELDEITTIFPNDLEHDQTLTLVNGLGSADSDITEHNVVEWGGMGDAKGDDGVALVKEGLRDDKIGEDKFGIQANDLIRILVAIATDQGRFDSVQTISKKNLMKSWDKTKDSLQNTINFLKSAKIEQLDIIPSINLILFLAYIINKEKNELGKRHKLLLKWFFTAAMWARYSGSTEQTIDFDLSIIKNNKEDYIKKMIGEIKNLRGGKLDVFENDLEVIARLDSPFGLYAVLL